MKKSVLFTVILVLGITAAGCNNRSADVYPGSVRPGTITIVGIHPQYNGQYAMFQTSRSSRPGGSGYLVTTIGSNGTAFDGIVIADGSITIPVYLVPYDSSQLESYGGSDSGIRIYVNINPDLP